jgi:hypothetical protein
MRRNNKEYAETYPKNICPVLTSESSGGTGFFYQNEEDVYLITAKHSVLPGYTKYFDEDSAATPDGAVCLEAGEDYSPRIEVLLRSLSDEKWLRKKIDIRDQEVFFKDCIDAIAIPLSFDPKDYNYVVYDGQDIQAVGEIEDDCDEMSSRGFDTGSLSRWDPENIYYTNPGQPRIVSLSNHRGVNEFVGKAIDIDGTESYMGLSGSPVLAKGLVGIHTSNREDLISFTKAGMIQKILNTPRKVQERNPMRAFGKTTKVSVSGGSKMNGMENTGVTVSKSAGSNQEGE